MAVDDLSIASRAAIDLAIRRTCRGCHLSSLDAEDLRAELWLYLLRDHARVLRRFQARSALETYLFTVFYRAAGKWLKTRARHRRCESNGGDTYETFSQRALCYPNVEKREIRREQKQALLRALRILPSSDRRLLVARLQGCSFREIALRHGLPLKTVQTRVYRAAASIRQHMQGTPLNKALAIVELEQTGEASTPR